MDERSTSEHSSVNSRRRNLIITLACDTAGVLFAVPGLIAFYGAYANRFDPAKLRECFDLALKCLPLSLLGSLVIIVGMKLKGCKLLPHPNAVGNTGRMTQKTRNVMCYCIGLVLGTVLFVWLYKAGYI